MMLNYIPAFYRIFICNDGAAAVVSENSNVCNSLRNTLNVMQPLVYNLAQSGGDD